MSTSEQPDLTNLVRSLIQLYKQSPFLALHIEVEQVNGDLHIGFVAPNEENNFEATVVPDTTFDDLTWSP